MTNIRAVEAFGTTPERIKAVFTATAPGPLEAAGMGEDELKQRLKDVAARERLKEFLMGRLNEGVLLNLQNYQFYAAKDLAWDCSPVNKLTIPLILYAQGKVRVEGLAKELAALPGGANYVKKDPNTGKPRLDLPRFLEVNVNLCRSIITRRVAAQANKYNNLWPFYKYEPRGTSQVDKLRADALSQRVDMMADQFGYRHHDVQVYRDMFKYAHVVDFVRCGWEREHSYELDADGNPQRSVAREGVSWVNPHPTRVFWDNSEPLAALNDDNGPEWVGFWDIQRYSALRNNPLYWNRDSISYNADFWSQLCAYQAYFNTLFQTTITPPASPSAQDVAGLNDRKNLVGLYSELKEDASVLFANFFWKLRPSEWGLGGYPEKVWMRIVAAGDGTVVFAEVLPSSPAAVCSLNEDDSRQLNISFLDELMPFQDQMTNLLTVMLELIKADLLKVVGVNTDVLTAEQTKAIRERLESENWSSGRPLVVEYSVAKIRDELGLDPKNIITIAETQGIGNALTECIRAMAQLAELAERLANISPNEQGQPAPREISATEVNEISATTSSVYSFISDAIDEYRAAKKRILYEAMCNNMGRLQVPVVGRYTARTIKAAGFDLDMESSEHAELAGGKAGRAMLLGSMKNLQHDFIFTSRDGSERAVNTQAANVLTQLMQYLFAVPLMQQLLSKEQVYEIFNEIFRLSGSGFDLRLEMSDGDDNSFGKDQAAQTQQVLETLAAQAQQLAEAVKQNTVDIAQQAQINAQQEALITSLQQLAETVKANAEGVHRVESKVKGGAAQITYKDAPEDIKRQMELQEGYVPSQNAAPADSVR